MIGRHQADQAFDAIVHVHVGTGLLAVAPDLDGAAVFSLGNFARDGCRRLFLAAVVGAERPVDVVEAHDARLELVVVVVVAAEFFGEQLFPAVTWLGIGRIRVFFLQRRDFGVLLFRLRVDAGRRREQESLHVVLLRSFEHVRVDQNVVFRDIGQERGDVADAAHVGRQVVNLIDVLCGSQAVFPDSQIENLKIVCCRSFVLGVFHIYPAHPMTICLQPFYKMMTDEPTCTRYQNPRFICHLRLLPPR